MVKYRVQVPEPDLLQLLLPASGDRLRKAAVAVCELALDKSGLESPLVREIMGLLRDGKPVSVALRAELQYLVNQLDEEYFDLRDAAETDDSAIPVHEDDDPSAPWHVMFHKARAAAAVLFACEDDPLFAAAEASYEARAAAHDDVNSVRTAITTALK